MTPRALPFLVVGAIGFVVQLAALFVLCDVCRWPTAAGTAVAVEIAVLHNFVWHQRWTWSDRQGVRESGLQRLVRFHLGNGLISLLANVLLTSAAVVLLRMPPVAANAIVVAITSTVTFTVANRWVFRRSLIALLTMVVTAMSSTASAAELRSETIAAWDRHIAGVERSWHERPFEQPVASPEGRSIAVPGGSIHEWRGSVVIRDMRVGALVDALQTPGLPPPADDILDARVLQHAGNTLRVYIKLTRTALVTVTYDTEHVVSFERLSPSVATSRSISTTIRETGGSDRGFVWRLNSYWTYRQAGDDVVVSLLSESLSRDVPLFARPVAGPIVDRIGRDSIRRALDAIERFGNGVRNNHLAAGF